MSNLMLVIRLRGSAGSPWYIEETLYNLRLKRVFNAMIYPDSSSLRGMLMKVQPYVTWGEVSENTLSHILLRLKPNGKPVQEALKGIGLDSIDSLKASLLEGKLKFNELDNQFKLPITLHPPRGGFKGSIKKPYKDEGEFGYRGQKINELVMKMV